MLNTKSTMPNQLMGCCVYGSSRRRKTLLRVLCIGLLAAMGSGCILPMKTYENPALRQHYEAEFKDRALDPIEGFWRSDNEFVEAIGVVYRTDPTLNEGFPFAARAISVRPKRALPYAPDFTRITGRCKPGSEPGVYHGQLLMVQGKRHFWKDCTIRLLDPTTAETTVHTSEPVLGGATQRSYLVGPAHVVEGRLDAVARRREGDSIPPTSSSGTGFLVSRSVVATNNHVIAEAKRIQCFIGEDAVAASVVATDKDMDLALLKLARQAPADVEPFALADSLGVKQGRRVFAMGYQITDVLGTKLSVQEGTISALSGFEGRSSQFQVSMNVHPGSSGGPLLDERGCVLGLVTGKLGLGYLLNTGDIPQGMMFAVKADLIRVLAAAAGVTDQLKFACPDRPEFDLEGITESYASAVVRIEVAR